MAEAGTSLRITTSDGEKQPFDPGKLWNSIYYPAKEAHYSDEEAIELADRVKKDVRQELEQSEEETFHTEEVRSLVLESLENRDEDVAFMYRTHLDLS